MEGRKSLRINAYLALKETAMSEFIIPGLLLVSTAVLIAFLDAAIAQVFYHAPGFNFKAIFKGIAEPLSCLLCWSMAGPSGRLAYAHFGEIHFFSC